MLVSYSVLVQFSTEKQLRGKERELSLPAVQSGGGGRGRGGRGSAGGGREGGGVRRLHQTRRHDDAAPPTSPPTPPIAPRHKGGAIPQGSQGVLGGGTVQLQQLLIGQLLRGRGHEGGGAGDGRGMLLVVEGGGGLVIGGGGEEGGGADAPAAHTTRTVTHGSPTQVHVERGVGQRGARGALGLVVRVVRVSSVRCGRVARCEWDREGSAMCEVCCLLLLLW